MYDYEQLLLTNCFLSLFLKVIKVKQSDDKFEVTLDVPQYKPEELKVTVINNILSIEGAHNEAKKGIYIQRLTKSVI